MQENMLVVVHPGSALGSADANLGRMEARAGRDALQWAFDHWEGSVLVIHGALSDELSSYPTFQRSLENLLARSRASGHRAFEVQGDDSEDHNQEAAMDQWLSEHASQSGGTAFTVTGAWFNHLGGGCVGSVFDRLRLRGQTAQVDSESALREPDDNLENGPEEPFDLWSKDWPASLESVLKRGRDAGFVGMVGECFAGAVGLAEQCFPGQDVRFVGAFNQALHEAGHSIGHVAIELDGATQKVYLDADGRPKPWDEIEAWGRLDPEDPDYIQAAEDADIPWDDEIANTVVRVDLTASDLVALCQLEDLSRVRRQLTKPSPARRRRPR